MPISLIEPDWPAPATVVAGTTTRGGGVSSGPYRSLNLGERCGDEPGAVAENRRRFSAAVGASPVWLRQCHGTELVPAAGHSGAAADAAFATGPGVACVVLTADCLPILLCEQSGACVAAVHAGWRGLAGGVVESAIAGLPAPPPRLLAWLGPAISQSHFEVGADVRTAFLNADPASDRHFLPNNRGRWQADLPGLAADRLRAAGIHRISASGLCTYADAARFYSYRRDGATGRMASYIAVTR